MIRAFKVVVLPSREPRGLSRLSDYGCSIHGSVW